MIGQSGYTYRLLPTLSFPLAAKFYRQEKHSARTDKRDEIFVAQHQNDISACLRIAPLDNERLLRGMLVSKASRGQGLARGLLAFSLSNTQYEKIWTFPLSPLHGFYASLGFEVKNFDEALPLCVQAAYTQYLKQGRDIKLALWQR